MEGAAGESVDVTKRITRTVVTRSDYGSVASVAGGSIGGEARIGLGVGTANNGITSISSVTSVYDSSVTNDALLTSGSSGLGFSSGHLERVQGDLSNFKKRIDANTEEQREHAGLMVGLQHKVEEYRRRIADIESQIASQKSDEHVSFNISETVDTWTPSVNVVTGTDLELNNRLEEERRRNEELRLQIAQLQVENQRIRQQFDVTLQDKERSYQIRERNLAQYLSEEQKKMMDLWTELQQVRRQCADYKDQTVRDLEQQRNEFVKVMRNINGVARQLNIVSTYEVNLRISHHYFHSTLVFRIYFIKVIFICFCNETALLIVLFS
uniref:IF rod domain-containing protein n=1 Tax=Parascaris univalens TaxID=6257 RepID=A0A915AMK6_PARUN